MRPVKAYRYAEADILLSTRQVTLGSRAVCVGIGTRHIESRKLRASVWYA